MSPVIIIITRHNLKVELFSFISSSTMITPRFKLIQSDATITITIRAPYCNLRALEISVEENVFLFLCSPYYLRLHLPGQIVENDSTRSAFDADSGEFSFMFEKLHQGEHFPDLEMITKLLCPKIEVSCEEDPNREKIVVLTQDDNPLPPTEDLSEEFGFALAGKRNFHGISSEFIDVFEVDPREIKLEKRRLLRLQYEQGRFSEDHYRADYIENEEILSIIGVESPWMQIKEDSFEFTPQELDFLKDLPNKEYNLSEEQIQYCFCGLIDILYSYCYDQRATQFEGSIESGWTIVKLAATFSWLDAFKTPKEALVSSFRRSVIYPLFRNFDLSQTVLTDLKQLLKLGERYIIRSLIEMYHIFLTGDCCRYIINNLFIKDYIIYIMKWDKNKWLEIVSQVNNTVIEKNELGLNLGELEDDLTMARLSELKITEDDSDDSECDSSSDSEDSSESDSSSSTSS